jgi:prevent-host-death family protein
MVMTIKRVAELKAHLSEVLAQVRGGASVVVCDRNTPIARLVPYEQGDLDDLRIEEAAVPPSDLLAIEGVRPRRRIDVVKLLRDSRDAR